MENKKVRRRKRRGDGGIEGGEGREFSGEGEKKKDEEDTEGENPPAPHSLLVFYLSSSRRLL